MSYLVIKGRVANYITWSFRQRSKLVQELKTTIRPINEAKLVFEAWPIRATFQKQKHVTSPNLIKFHLRILLPVRTFKFLSLDQKELSATLTEVFKTKPQCRNFTEYLNNKVKKDGLNICNLWLNSTNNISKEILNYTVYTENEN